MRGAGSGGRQGHSFTVPPFAELVEEPADIGACLRHARENVDRNRMPLQRGGLRHALFSANEGLELCARAYLPHCRAIADPAVARNFPYAAIISSMRKITGQFGKHNHAGAGPVRQAATAMDKFEPLLKKLGGPRARAALWKKSPGSELVAGEQKLPDGLGLAASGRGRPELQTPASFQQEEPSRRLTAIAPITPDEHLATLPGVFHGEFKRSGSRPMASLLGGREIPAAKAPHVGRLFAPAELFLCTTAIVNGFIRQQISRHHAQIDGVASTEVHARHRGAVGLLPNKIYGACDMLPRRLGGQPLAPPDLRAAGGCGPKPVHAPRPARNAWGGASAAVGNRGRSGRGNAGAGHKQPPLRAPAPSAAPPCVLRPCQRARIGQSRRAAAGQPPGRRTPPAHPPGRAARAAAQRGR